MQGMTPPNTACHPLEIRARLWYAQAFRTVSKSGGAISAVLARGVPDMHLHQVQCDAKAPRHSTKVCNMFLFDMQAKNSCHNELHRPRHDKICG